MTDDVRVVDPSDVRITRWVADRRGIVQIVSLAVLGFPWLLVSFFGLRWGWLSLAVLPLVAYLMIVTYIVEGTDDVDR